MKWVLQKLKATSHLEKIDELDDIQVIITPNHLDMSGFVNIKNLVYHVKNPSLSRCQRIMSNHELFILTSSK